MTKSFHKEMHTYLESRTIRRVRRETRRALIKQKINDFFQWCKDMFSAQTPSLEGLTQDTTYIFKKIKSPAHAWIDSKITKPKIEPEKPKEELDENEWELLQAQLEK